MFNCAIIIIISYLFSFFRSSSRRLSDLMSPSELLENSLDIDDIYQALNEEGSIISSIILRRLM